LYSIFSTLTCPFSAATVIDGEVASTPIPAQIAAILAIRDKFMRMIFSQFDFTTRRHNTIPRARNNRPVGFAPRFLGAGIIA
jgi:hypothetical protein